MLWHLTPEQVAAGHGTPEAIPVTPEIAVHGYDNLNGIVAMSDRRLIVGHRADGLLSTPRAAGRSCRSPGRPFR